MPGSGKHNVNNIDSFFKVRPSRTTIREGETISFLEKGKLVKQEKRNGVVYETIYVEQGTQEAESTRTTASTSASTGDITSVTAGTGLSGGGVSGPVTLSIDSTVVTLTGTQTLTNKTLTSPIISSISNTGTLTLPTSTDTLVGRATTDTLTNKTLTAPTFTGTAQGASLTLTGDLTVQGDTTTLNTATLQVEDNNIVLNYHASNDTSSTADGSGITIQDAVNSTTDATILWDATNDEFDFSHTITAPNFTGNLTGNVTGNVTGNLTGNVTGDVTGNADTATKLANARDIELTGDITGVTPGAGFDGSAAVSISTTIADDSVALGTKTTGNYVATITAGQGLASNGATSGEGISHTLSLDLSELPTSTLDGDGDFFAVVDSANAQKKLTKGNINLSGFNNDSGFTSNAGTVTSVAVSGGNGLTSSGGPITSSGTITLNVGEGTGIDVTANAISLDVSDVPALPQNVVTGDNFLVYNSTDGTALATVSELQSALSIPSISGTNDGVVTKNPNDTLTAEANLTFDGSTLTVNGDIRINDSVAGGLEVGTSQDLQIYHNGTNSFGADNYTGHLIFQNRADDQDIIFKNDDGSGGVTEYFRLNGDNVTNIFSKNVVMASDAEIYLQTGGESIAFMGVSDANYRKALYSTNDDHYVTNRHTGGDLILMSNNGSAGGETERLRFVAGSGTQNAYFSNVNVGIGTSSPQQKLHIFQTEGGVGAKHATIRLGGYSTVGAEIAAYRHTGNSNDQGLIFSTYHNTNGTTDTMTLDSDGNVGIGTTSPGYKLDVVGTDNDAGIRVTRGNSASQQLFIRGYQIYNSGNHLLINAADTKELRLGHVSSTAEVVLDSSGNVGIGTNSPQVNLDVTGNSNGDHALGLRAGDISAASPNSSQIIFSYNGSAYNSSGYAHSIRTRHNAGAEAGNSIQFWLWDQGTDTASTLGSKHVMSIEGNGRVGIGTQSPAYKLHLEQAGGVMQQLKATDSNQAYMKFVNLTTGDGVYTDGFLFGLDSDETVAIWNYEATAMRFATSGAEKMRIQSGGNVGIGTSLPGHKLDVNGNINTTGAYYIDDSEIIDTNKRLKNLTSAVGTDRSGGTHIVDFATPATPGSTGWYTICKASSADARGGGIINISATGGSITPVTITIDFMVDWSGNLNRCNTQGLSGHFTKVRLIETASTTELQIYVNTTVAQAMYVSFQQDRYNPNYSLLDPWATATPTVTGHEILLRNASVYSNTSNTSALVVSDNARRLELGRDSIKSTDLSGSTTQLYINSNTTFSGTATFGGSVSGVTTLTTSSSITTGYGVAFTNGNTNFLMYNNTGENLIYLRDTTNGQMLQTWTTSSTTIHKPLYVTGDIRAADGSVGSPAFRFTSDTNTGIYRKSEDYMAFVASGYERFAANGNGLDLGGGSANKIVHNTTATRDKYRLWNSSHYAIGMDNAMSYGGLNDYAMTFQMNSESDRGFVWLDSSHSDAQGAMALTTEGKLTVAHSMRLGYGEGDTTTPGATYRLDVSGSIGATADVVAYISSDKKLKDNIKNIANPLEKLEKLNGVEFDWNDKQDLYKGHDIGVIAQEVEEVLPEIVDTREDGHKAVKYDRMVALLIEVAKEQQEQINELKEKLNG